LHTFSWRRPKSVSGPRGTVRVILFRLRARDFRGTIRVQVFPGHAAGIPRSPRQIAHSTHSWVTGTGRQGPAHFPRAPTGTRTCWTPIQAAGPAASGSRRGLCFPGILVVSRLCNPVSALQLMAGRSAPAALALVEVRMGTCDCPGPAPPQLLWRFGNRKGKKRAPRGIRLAKTFSTSTRGEAGH